jgi:hypothetical protein
VGSVEEHDHCPQEEHQGAPRDQGAGPDQKKKTQEGFDGAQNPFQKALALGIEYLDSEVPEQSSSSASGPVSEPRAPTKIQESMEEEAERDIEEDEEGQPSA